MRMKLSIIIFSQIHFHRESNLYLQSEIKHRSAFKKQATQRGESSAQSSNQGAENRDR